MKTKLFYTTIILIFTLTFIFCGSDNQEVSDINEPTENNIDTTPPTIIHSKISSAISYNPITIEATVTDDVALLHVKLYYRNGSSGSFIFEEMTGDTDIYSVQIPSNSVFPPTIQYYIKAKDTSDNIQYYGNEGETLSEPTNNPINISINEPTENNQITIYSFGFTHIWAWNKNDDNEQLFDEWPGQPMNNKVDGWYKWTFDEATSIELVLSNNGDNQTNDLFLEEGNWWYYKTEIHDTEPLNADYKEVVLKFYSSVFDEVYLTGNFNGWCISSNKMLKNGNEFSITVPLHNNLFYRFYTNNASFLDPLSKNDFINMYSIHEILSESHTNLTENITFVSGTYIDLLTNAPTYNINEYDNFYEKLIEVLSPFGNNLSPVHQKIRYYIVDYDASFSYFALYHESSCWDRDNVKSSHEMIHCIINIENSGFNEGVAQSFQKEGNYNYKEQNVNLSARNIQSNRGNLSLDNLIENWATQWDNYMLMGSFVFYNFFVDNEVSNQFSNFLFDIRYDDDLTTIKNKYYSITNKNFDTVVSEWNDWLSTIDENSDIYVSSWD